MKGLVKVNAKAIVALIVPLIMAGVAAVGLDVDVNAVTAIITSVVTAAMVWVTKNSSGVVVPV